VRMNIEVCNISCHLTVTRDTQPSLPETGGAIMGHGEGVKQNVMVSALSMDIIVLRVIIFQWMWTMRGKETVSIPSQTSTLDGPIPQSMTFWLY
jgi:hypothetical protein